MVDRQRERILDALRLSSYPLDDDELARRTGITPRQSVNQACRALQRDGLLRRVAGPDGKLVNLVGGADGPEPIAGLGDDPEGIGSGPIATAGVQEFEGLATPPGNSNEQRQAERVMLDLLAERRGQSLRPGRITVPSGARVELDGIDEKQTVLVECWAHQGRPKSAQRHKVLADAFKLSWIRSTLYPRPELVLCLCDPVAAAPFLPGARTWAAQALSDLDISLEIVELPADVLAAVVEAQGRQHR